MLHSDMIQDVTPSPIAGRPARRQCLRILLCHLLAIAHLAVPASQSLADTNATTDLDRPAIPPEEAVKLFQVPAGLEISLFAAEKKVAQPLSISFDDRGRMWVIQYLQYPVPEGLKPVEVDQYLRTVYDRIPEPPPRGPRGADRITIYEDTDGDGRPDKSKDFINGLNLCSGVEVGQGGVFVLQTPYLLFYPDRDGNDVPDGDPEVLLSGFGMNDAHAVANSLTWGPDGWLYGAQGSTVTANIRGIEFQQGIWRYHPATKRFELFAEGGGNTWGIDFDLNGNLFAGGNTAQPLCHHVQGGYYVKGFGKHGPLHNPYTYGYFPAMAHSGYLGHGLTGGFVLYYGGAFPAEFNGVCIYPNIRQSAARWAYVDVKGSTFATRFGGDFILSEDLGFRPVDSCVGPDGALYVADWYDFHIAHRDTRDITKHYMPRKDDGRIWKVAAPGTASKPIFTGTPLRKRSSQELVALLRSGNEWYVRQARTILGERRDKSVLPVLEEMIFSSPTQPLALSALWSHYLTAGLDPPLCQRTLQHPAEYVRAWTIRLLGDEGVIPENLQPRLVEMAASDPSPIVRSQLAATAKRLSGAQALPIIARLIEHSEDVDDLHIPLMIWWAIENKAISDREAVMRMVMSGDAKELPLVRKFMAPRLVRRYTAEQSEVGFVSCARLIEAAPSEADVEALIAAMDQELAGQSVASIPPALKQVLERLIESDPNSNALVRLALRFGYPQAYGRAMTIVGNRNAPEADRLQLIRTLSETSGNACAADLLGLLATDQSAAVASAILTALERSDRVEIAGKILALYPELKPPLKEQACELLCSRKAWALALLEAIDQQTLPRSTLSLAQLRRIQLHADPAIDALLEKNWGKIRSVSSAEVHQRVAALTKSVASHTADAAAGKAVFTNNCGKCHKLFGAGNSIGPDLTGAERVRLDVLLANIVDPSGVVRPEFQTYVAVTDDGRVLTGLLVESSPRTVTLLDPANIRTVIARDNLEEIKASSLSLMPEQLLDKLSEQELCDLIAYLQSDRSAAQSK
ncbi:MAG TPA: PVC-type heme-binding CxxCH protein [Pirellulales bacterium]|jgi:putative membrane-bound dehydrogenase-like protein|nr:PVC-type heme-binding CxxCH protein [Pirellulales bacterium]